MVRDMKWNADGQRICIVYEDGKALSFSRFVSNACHTLEERAEQTVYCLARHREAMRGNPPAVSSSV